MTPVSRSPAAPADFHWGLQSPVWARVFLRLPWMSTVPFAATYIWSPSSSHFFHALPGFYPLFLWLHDTTSQLDFLPQCFIASGNSARWTHLSLPRSPCRLISTLFFSFPLSIKCDFYSTDEPFSTAALVEHHMVKTGCFFFSRIFSPFKKHLIKHEIGPKNTERKKFKFTKLYVIKKSLKHHIWLYKKSSPFVVKETC